MRRGSCSNVKEVTSTINEFERLRLWHGGAEGVAAGPACGEGVLVNLIEHNVLRVRNMLRLSVEIGLIYLPMDNRERSLKDIDEKLDGIMTTITDRNPDVQPPVMA